MFQIGNKNLYWELKCILFIIFRKSSYFLFCFYLFDNIHDLLFLIPIFEIISSLMYVVFSFIYYLFLFIFLLTCFHFIDVYKHTLLSKGNFFFFFYIILSVSCITKNIVDLFNDFSFFLSYLDSLIIS